VNFMPPRMFRQIFNMLFCQAQFFRDASWTATGTWASPPADRRDNLEDQAV
jgi:hypothetical protein